MTHEVLLGAHHSTSFTYTTSNRLIMSKTALVTGATGLLGREVVEAFSLGGWDVIGTGFSRAKPPSILKVDLGDEAAIDKVLEDAK